MNVAIARHGNVGDNAFREATNAYLRQFQYGNARSDDLWQVLTASTGLPIDRIMSSFITQPGVPLVTATSACVAGRTELTLKQERLLVDSTSPTPQTWTIPVCMPGQCGPQCALFDASKLTVTTNGCTTPPVNGDASGYFRVLSPANRADAPSPIAALVMLNDAWAAAQIGKQPVARFLELVKSVAGRRVPQLTASLAGSLSPLRAILPNAADQDRFDIWVRRTVLPSLPGYGPPPAMTETEHAAGIRRARIVEGAAEGRQFHHAGGLRPDERALLFAPGVARTDNRSVLNHDLGVTGGSAIQRAKVHQAAVPGPGERVGALLGRRAEAGNQAARVHRRRERAIAAERRDGHDAVLQRPHESDRAGH